MCHEYSIYVESINSLHVNISAVHGFYMYGIIILVVINCMMNMMITLLALKDSTVIAVLHGGGF